MNRLFIAKEYLALWCQDRPVSGPVEQFDAELRLEVGDRNTNS